MNNEQTKITVKVESNLFRAFMHKINCLFIKRDAFLNQIIKIETEHLKVDLAGKKLTSKANRYISNDLKRRGTTSVNIVVDKDVANLLNEVVAEANIVRDAFINRVILLLIGNDSVLDFFDLPHFINGNTYNSAVPNAVPTAPFKALSLFQKDPLYYIRLACDDSKGVGLYLLEIPMLPAFSCWIDDSEIRTIPNDSEKWVKDLDKMIEESFSKIANNMLSLEGVKK